jgi:hypothetical protein
VVEGSSSNGADSEIWWEPAVVGSSGTFTVTGTAPTAINAAITIVEVSGLTGVVDKTKAQGALNTSTTITVTSSSANTNANDLVIASVASGGEGAAIGLSSPANTGYSSINLLPGAPSPGYQGAVQTSFKVVSAIETPAARSKSSTPGRVKIPHLCDGVKDDYASA